jgi:hypothetical protein
MKSGLPVLVLAAASAAAAQDDAARIHRFESGRLKLDAPINDALTSWKVPENELTHKTPVTLAHLLSHTAGTTTSGFHGYVPGDPLPTFLQILDGAPPANTLPVRIDKRPGESFRYSGGGSIVALAVQGVTKQPYVPYMKTTILDPLGMSRSMFVQPLPLELLREAAVGHGAGGAPIVGLYYTYPELAAAGLWTTAMDLARFGAGIQLSLAGRPGAILKRETAARMVTPVSGPAGLGFFVDAVMTNSENGPSLIREIMRGLAVEYGWEGADVEVVKPVAVAPERLAPLAGRYVLGSDTAITLAPKGSRLTLDEALRPTVELVRIAADTFTRTDRRVRYRLEGERLLEEDGENKRSATRSASEDLVPSELLAAGRVEAARGLELVPTDPETAAYRSWANDVWRQRAEVLEAAAEGVRR